MNFLYKSAVAAAVCAAVLAGCKKNETVQGKLQSPSPELESVGIDNAVVVWKAVEGAQSYELFINSMTTVTAEGTRYELMDLQDGTYYTVRMRAIPSKGDVRQASGYGSTLRFTTGKKEMLSTPEMTVESLAADRARVSWMAVKNAGGYVLSIDGQEQAVSQTTFTMEDLEPSTSYLVMVKAVPSQDETSLYFDSAWAEKEITTRGPERLSAPELSVSAITATGFTVNWPLVENAYSYSVSLNGGESFEVQTKYCTFGDLTEGNSYTVKVVAKPSEELSALYQPSKEASVTVVPRGPSGGDTGGNEDYIIDQE